MHVIDAVLDTFSNLFRSHRYPPLEKLQQCIISSGQEEGGNTNLTVPEERLEKLIQEMERAIEEIRKAIRKTKLVIVIGFTALIAFQILLRWIGF
jgi:hypothetical protein